MGTWGGLAPAACCLLGALLLTVTVYGSPQPYPDWSIWDMLGNANQSKSNKENEQITVSLQPYRRDWNGSGLAPAGHYTFLTFDNVINKSKSNQEHEQISAHLPTASVYPPHSTTGWRERVIPDNKEKTSVEKHDVNLTRNKEDDEKLKVETSGSSSPQEVHFALSLVPLLRAQPAPNRLDAESDILRYFKQHSG